MSQPTADRNLLFGVLALQMDFITREQLIAAMQAWVFDKQKSLGQILCEQQVLPEDNRVLLDALMQKHLAKHDNDPEKSLAAVSSVTDVKKDLVQIADADVQASLQSFGTSKPPKKNVDIYATVAPSSASQTLVGGARFRILRPHARGGLGEVFVARDEELHREVALKEIQERAADDEESRARFMLEAEITGGLEHPGIVPVYGLGTYGDGRPYYAMRFIRGDSLKDAIERFHRNEKTMAAGQRNVELRALLGRFIDVCNAIAYAHNRGVLHRDLKPGNIMLGRYGETLVVDWGLAKPMGETAQATQATEPGEGSLVPHSISSSSQTLMGTAMGTPQYMSPEQAAGRLDQLGPASDVYSLGATLFCLLTGQPPFSEPDVGTILQKVQRGEFPKPRTIKLNVPPALEAICLKSMALKPEERYPTPHVLADDIEHWLADEPVSAWPEPWTVKARRWISRHRVFVTSAAAAVSVALVGFVVATVLLTAANERERLAKLDALEQKDKAEQNFKLARQAVDRYHTDVSESVLLNEPGMQPLRKKLLEAAREFYGKFVKERGNDKSVQGELGRATFRLAQITADIDSELDAIKLHEQAIAIFEKQPSGQADADTDFDLATSWHHLGRLRRLTDQIDPSEEATKKALSLWERLTKEHPRENRFSAGLARTQMGLGNFYQYVRRLNDAEPFYQSAIANWQALAKADPQLPAYRRDWAVTENNLGMIYASQAKPKEADLAFRTALALEKQLVEDAPNVSKYQNDLAKTMFNLRDVKDATRIWQGLIARHPALTDPHITLGEAYARLGAVYSRDGEFEKAEGACQTALAIKRKLAGRHPGVPSYQGDLARGLFALGHVERAAGQFDKAMTAYREARAIQEKLVRDLPKAAFYREELYRTCFELGDAEVKNAKLDGALDAYTRALELAPAAQKPLVQLGRATVLARLGNHVEAIGIIEPMVGKTRIGEILYRFAVVYALSAAAAEKDVARSDENRQQLAEQYAAQAMKLLTDAGMTGMFKSATNQRRLSADPDLQTLRARDDFKKLASQAMP